MPIRSTLPRLALALLVLAGVSQALAAGKCERLIATGNPDQPPYLWRDPQQPKALVGVGADLLKALGSELGVEVEVLYAGKAAAAEADALNGRADLLLGTYLSLERLERYDFVHPAYLEVPVQVWAQRDKAPLFARYADLASHRGLAVASENFPTRLIQRLDEEFKVEHTGKALDALNKLQQGKVDYLLLERHVGEALAGRLGLSGELIPLEPPLAREPLYLAISHNSACNDPWLRGQLARKMAELRASGVPQSLLQRNIERWQAQKTPPATP